MSLEVSVSGDKDVVKVYGITEISQYEEIQATKQKKKQKH